MDLDTDEIPWPDTPGSGDINVVLGWLIASREGRTLADALAEYDLMDIWNPRGIVPRRKQLVENNHD